MGEPYFDESELVALEGLGRISPTQGAWDPETAAFMAGCALLAYGPYGAGSSQGDRDKVQEAAELLNLEMAADEDFGDVTNGGLTIDTQFLVLRPMAGGGRRGNEYAIVAFRGTEGMSDLAADLDSARVPFPIAEDVILDVHHGFRNAFAAAWPKVLDRLAAATGGEPPVPANAIWFVGHSLGGALALLAGLAWKASGEERDVLGVYTYGQPKIDDGAFNAVLGGAFQARTFRHVFDRDGVPLLPPGFLGFNHGGTERFLVKETGAYVPEPSEEMRRPAEVLAWLFMVGCVTRGLFTSGLALRRLLDAHAILGYLRALTPPVPPPATPHDAPPESLVNYLVQQGERHEFRARERMFSDRWPGESYRGSARQNLRLLHRLIAEYDGVEALELASDAYAAGASVKVCVRKGNRRGDLVDKTDLIIETPLLRQSVPGKLDDAVEIGNARAGIFPVVVRFGRASTLFWLFGTGRDRVQMRAVIGDSWTTANEESDRWKRVEHVAARAPTPLLPQQIARLRESLESPVLLGELWRAGTANGALLASLRRVAAEWGKDPLKVAGLVQGGAVCSMALLTAAYIPLMWGSAARVCATAFADPAVEFLLDICSDLVATSDLEQDAKKPLLNEILKLRLLYAAFPVVYGKQTTERLLDALRLVDTATQGWEELMQTEVPLGTARASVRVLLQQGEYMHVLLEFVKRTNR